MATLKDVAKLANVDVSTVSRALNNTSYVHPDTKKKIFKAVEQLSYRPNLLAKGLKQGKRRTLGVVVPSVNLSIFGEIVQGIEMQAGNRGYSLMICLTKDDPDIEAECLNRLRNGLVDGILIASTGQNTRLIRDIKANGVAVVQLVRNQDRKFSSVEADCFSCGYEAAKYLYKKGCTKIGFINGSTEFTPYAERYRGYHKAMKELGLKEYQVESGLPRGNYFKDGYKGVERLKEAFDEVDGIMVAADMQGIGVLRALKESGKKVPKEVKAGEKVNAQAEFIMLNHEGGKYMPLFTSLSELQKWNGAPDCKAVPMSMANYVAMLSDPKSTAAGIVLDPVSYTHLTLPTNSRV